MKRVKEIGYTIIIVTAMVASLFCVNQLATARATPAGCQDDLWWTIDATRRLLCDGPMFADGTWNRLRIRYTPAHYVPFTCSYSRYYSSCSGGYHVEYSEAEHIIYPINPNGENKVLPDEPGYLGDSTAGVTLR